YENVKTNYRKYLSTILPEEWIEVTNTYNNMYQYKVALSNENIKQKVDHELANQMNNQMFMGLEQDTSQLSSDKVLSNDENKALQKKYLGYYSYKEVKQPFNADYTFYIFKFDYLYNMGKGRYGLEELRDIRKDYEKELNIQSIDYNWGDGVELGNKPKYIIYHHSASSNLSSEQIHDMHLQRGWSGIGYHFYIRKDGTIYRGRKEEMIGAHAKGRNRDSIGICLEGNFEDESITYKQMNSLVKLSADMIIKYNIEESEGHKDVYNTLCPGKNFDIKEIQEKVADELIRLREE
ncbi:MAG: peptidoglycan recognition family protein, partial [Clostridium sp.]|nr:peptidoglycan recognition family protein [Clostridium sp.]